MFFGASRTMKHRSASVLLLPQAGPFAASSPIAVSTLADETWGNLTGFAGGNRFAPVTRKNVTLTGLRTFSQFALFLWCNRLTITTGGLSASGNGGAASDEGSGGGSGSSGGGAGGSDTSRPQFGGDGGTKNNGQGTDFADGGVGWAETYLAGDTFPSYPVGGLGGNDFSGSALGGSGSALSGGGGAGGISDTIMKEFGGGGGGAGGGLTLFCNELVTLGATQVEILSCRGGFGGNAEAGGSGGGGAGGCVYIAAKKYDGGLSESKFSVKGGLGGSGNYGTQFAQDGLSGEVFFYEITSSNTLVLRNYNDVWNNL